MTDEKVTQQSDKIKINYRTGLIISAIGASISLILFPWAFYKAYYPLIDIEGAKGSEGCLSNVEIFYPHFNDIGILSGVLYLIAMYGFYRKKESSIIFAVSASTLALKGSFWPMVPPLSNDLFPFYIFIFVPALVLFLMNARFVANLPIRRIIYATVAGMAMITSFMNGIAAVNRAIVIEAPTNWIYIVTTRMNLYAGLAMSAVVVGILLCPTKEWVKLVAFGSGITELIVGFPVAIAYSIAEEKFALFFLGPTLTIIMLFIVFVKMKAPYKD